MKLVKFSNGKWGIRRGTFFYVYLDFYATPVGWVGKESMYFGDCMVSEGAAKARFYELNKTKPSLPWKGITEQVIE